MKRYLQVVTIIVAVLLFAVPAPKCVEGNVEKVQHKKPTTQTTKPKPEAETVVKTTEMTAEMIAEEEYYDSLELLALCVEAEAGNQSLEGRRYVVSTVLNRVADEDFPNSIEEVISQPYQFSTYWNGAIDKAEPSELTYEAVRLELEEQINTEVMYFTAGRYSKYGTPWKKIGDHYFSFK